LLPRLNLANAMSPNRRKEKNCPLLSFGPP